MYTLDTSEAKKADNTGSRITELGKYVGHFTQAEDVTAKTGTKGLSLSFESNGKSANLSIYTIRNNDDKLQGYQTLMAMMTCLQLRNLTEREGTVKVWDNVARKEVERAGLTFPELCNKRIGLLLETEDYLKQDGTTGTKMVIAGVFQADTDLTASEILDRKTTPERLSQMEMRLRHRPVKGAPAAAPASHGGYGHQQAAPAYGGNSGFNDLDDSIPF